MNRRDFFKGLLASAAVTQLGLMPGAAMADPNQVITRTVGGWTQMSQTFSDQGIDWCLSVFVKGDVDSVKLVKGTIHLAKGHGEVILGQYSLT